MATSLINGLGGTSGFGENALPREDDVPSLEIDLTSIVAGGIDLFGETYTSLFINYNGSVTFGDALEAFSPTAITAATTIPIVAPFWGDVDTRGGTVTATPGGTSTGSNLVWYDIDVVNRVFTVTWDDVAYYDQHSDRLNAFQLRIIAVGTAGDFDIQFRYEAINWTTGDASGGTGGLGGDVAVAGYSAGDGVNFFQLPQSGNQAGMLGLPNASNVATPGLFTFSVRNGIPVVAQFSVSAASADKAEGNSGGTAFTFTVSLSGDTSIARSVAYAVAGSGANAASSADFAGGALPTGTVSFAVGETSKTITVTVQGDAAVEADETFALSLSAPTGGATLGTSTAGGTIRNDDSAAGTQVSIAAASADRAEGNVGPTPFTFTLTRTGDVSGTHSVNWAVTGSGAAPTNGTDFVGGVLPSGSVTFAPGETSKTLMVNIQGDLVVEADETFTVTISAPAQSTGDQTTSNTGTIPSTGQTLGISLTARDASSSTSEAVSGLVSRSGGSGIGQYNIAFVIDRSGSTADTFVGKQSIGDLNGDGTANTILDAEIAGFEALLASINGLGLGSANIAVISFESGATTHLTTTVAADANKNGTLDVVETLRSLQATGSTNYEAGLQQAEAFYAGAPSGQNVLFFLSDGFPTSQNYGDEVSRLLLAKTDIRAYGVGSQASAPALDLVDDGLANNTATIVLDPSQLSSGLLGSGVKLAEIARVELLVNGVVVQTIQPNQLVQTPLGLQYTGTLTGLSVAAAEQITARVVATDAATTTVSTTQTLEVAGVAIGTSTATGVVRNDDGITEICIETASSTLKEGHVGPTPFTFTVTREGDLSGTHSVKWSVSSIGGAPANAVDFVGGVLPSGTVTFAPGESAKTITVNVQGDTGLELDETFLVSLSSPATVGGGGSGNQTTSNSGTIVSTGQTLGISLTAPDASSSTSEAVSGLVSRSGGSGTGQYNIAFVVDRSGSTASTFSGAKTVADLNGDGTANTVLDAEIAGFEAVLASINSLGLGSATIAVISFESGAATNLVTTAGADANKNGVLDVVEALRGLKTGGSTNYEAGLQQAEAFYKGAPSGQNVLFFLSDGQPDSTTAYTDEVSRLLAAKVGIQSFGVGSGAVAGPLDLVDDGLANNTATIVLDPSQLTSGLLGGGVKLAEIARVELLVNGVVVQTIQPNQLVQTPLGLQYTGTLTGLSVSSSEQITARVIATDAAATTVATTQTLEVLSGSTVELCDDPTAVGTIINDDTEICIETASSTLKEGHVGPTPFTFTVTREGDLSGTHSVKWSVSSIGGAPANAVDFVGGVLPSGTVTFAPGESAKTITVNVQGDTGVELDETFLVSLSSPATVGGGGSGNQTTSNSGTIVSTGQTLGISLTAPDASSSTSEAVSGLVSRSGGSGTGQYNIAFVVDRSGSTASTFSGAKTVADLNGDGTANTVLDAEIAGFEAVLASINSLGLGSATIAVISFESGAATNLVTTAGADANKNGVLDVVEALRGLKTGGSTNYEAGLQQAEAFYKGAPSGQNVLFFLSDGQPDSTTAYADEVSRLLAAKVGIQSFGVGSGAVAGPLDLVDDGLANNTATIVLDPSQLTSGLLGGGVKLAEIARVELLVNGVVVQTIQPNQLVQTPLGLQYTGTMTGLSVSSSEQITARVIATDAAATTVATTQTLEVLSGSHVQLCDDPTAIGTIINDDTEICIETASSTLKEGHVGPTPFTFTVTREGDLSGTHSVKWSVSNIGGAPANATDFVGGVLPSGTVTFAPGESAKTITVNVQGDTGLELDETFVVSLSSPVTVGGGSGNQTTSNSGTIVSTGQTLGISLTAPDASSSTSEAVSGLVSRSGGSGTGQYNIAFVVDRSGSTASTFSGAKTVADLNGDGTANTVLDAEIAGFEAVLASINSLGLGSATIAVISFESGAATNLVTTAGADANKNGVLDVVEALRGLKTGGSTNYEAGLQQAEAFYKGAPSGQNVLFFLSDGQPDSTTAYADEVSRLLAAKVGIQSFGVGSGAVAGPLDLVDDGLANNTATIVLDPSQLTSGLLGGGVKLAEIARVELLVNGVVVQTIQPNQLVQTPLGLQYTGTLTGLSVSSSEQITARVIATDAAVTTVATTQTLEVMSGSGVVLCDDPTAIGTILNDDGTEICIHPANATLKEGHVGPTPFTFTVEREGDLSGTHSVKWSVSSTGGASANAVDFVGSVLPSGTVTFAPGESAKTITVNVQGDTGLELDETFLVSLSSPATVGGGSGNQTTSNSGTIVSTGQTLGISLTAPDASSSTSEAVSGLVSRSGGSGTGQYNIAFVVDRSGSTASTFSGAKTVADLNGDGTANTVLDAEIAGFEAVLSSINSLGLGSATIAVISFESGAATNLVTTAGADANKNGVLDVVEALRGLKTGGSTNYEAGLQQAEAFYKGAPSGQNVLFFLSDGQPDSTTAYADEVSRLLAAKVGIQSFGVGSGAVAGPLDLVDDGLANNTATIVLDPSQLTSGLLGGGVKLAEIARVELLVNGVVVQTIQPNQLVQTPLGLQYTGTLTGLSVSSSEQITARVIATDAAVTTVATTQTLEVLSGSTVQLCTDHPTAVGTILNDDTAILTAYDDAYIAAKDTVLHIGAPSGVLFNDIASPPVTATLLTNPTRGTVALSANGGFDYTPAPDRTGIDKFTYRTTGSNGTDDAEAVIYVTPVVVGGGSTTLALVALTAEQQIAATYAAYFGRAADAGGFQFWVGEFQRELPVQGPAPLFANIASSFGISNEARGLYPFLANPFTATDAQISSFIDSVYNNLFNRSSDAGGLGYWTGQIRQALASNKFVGSVLVDIMSGAQDTAAGKDITTLMGKVAVSIEYVQEQQRLGSLWTPADDGAEARTLLQAVTADPLSVLVGVARAHDLVVADIA